ncbi:MAG: hypothetical protein RBT63_05765, partial [Bdellovibrionales bacterium]|nr:hypothetical protein [Bdellovibrionales bacterium]
MRKLVDRPVSAKLSALSMLALAVLTLSYQNCADSFSIRNELESQQETISPFESLSLNTQEDIQMFGANVAATRDPELVRAAGSSSRLDREHYLRRSCYCINCHEQTGPAVDQAPRMIQAVAESNCRYVRWATFNWVDLHGKQTSELPENEVAAKRTREMATFASFISRLPKGVIAEFALPEIVSEAAVKALRVTSAEEAKLNELARKHNPSAYPFEGLRYERVSRGEANNWGGGYRNSIPVLDTKDGWHYHLLLYIRAHDAGARGFYLPQANHRFMGDSRGRESHFESFIRALQDYAVSRSEVDSIFGSESLEQLYHGVNGRPANAHLIDFVKYIVDLEVAEKDMATGKYSGLRPNGSRINCRHS